MSHNNRYILKKVARVLALICVIAVVFVSFHACSIYFQVRNSMQIDETSYIDIDYERPPIDIKAERSVNFLVIGVDSRDGEGNAKIGGDQKDVQGLHNSDTTILVHVSSDRKNVTAVSIPRDTIVDSSECHLKGEKKTKAENEVMFNSIFAKAWAVSQDDYSAAQCVQKTVENFSHTFINYVVIADFAGFENMVNALDGVNICLNEAIDSPDAGELKLSAGNHHLDGFQAVNFARARKGEGLGDQSDLGRIRRQQKLVGSIFKTALSKNLSEIKTTRNFVIETTKSFKTTMPFDVALGLAWTLKELDLKNVRFIMAPVEAWQKNHNRVVFKKEVDQIWEKLKKDEVIEKEVEENNTEKPAIVVETAERSDLCD